MKKRVDFCGLRISSTFVIFAACFCVPVCCDRPRENIFVLQDPNSSDNRTVILITWRDENGSRCEVFGNNTVFTGGPVVFLMQADYSVPGYVIS
ncbi:hypothetical protein NPIL_641751 [Nephila pilipes]|uniref:Uncharacterized protein n=1 Tax=Nephila pilipes TaxID=299642 RepID=A0A8X6N5T7_NEPPI|nr:hypothetical protein NPIL_641751 [Nephila pilipes]